MVPGGFGLYTMTVETPVSLSRHDATEAPETNEVNSTEITYKQDHTLLSLSFYKVTVLTLLKETCTLKCVFDIRLAPDS